MKIIVPMVFSNTEIEAGGKYIKPLYEIERRTILEHVVGKLSEVHEAKFVFIIHQKDVAAYHLDNVLAMLCPDCEIVVAKGKTHGSACSCLLAIEQINENAPLLVAGVDKYLDIDINEAIQYFETKNLDAGAVVFDDIHPQWSYVALDEDGLVVEAQEKNPISRNACAGVFYYHQGKDFVQAVMRMIKKGAVTNGQYYVAPAFNELILQGKRIGVYKIDRDQYYSFTSEKGMPMALQMTASPSFFWKGDES